MRLIFQQSEFPAEVAGTIILVEKGTCPGAVKVALGVKAGAVGAIVHNDDAGQFCEYSLERQSTPEESYVPTIGVSKSMAEILNRHITLSLPVCVTICAQGCVP